MLNYRIFRTMSMSNLIQFLLFLTCLIFCCVIHRCLLLFIRLLFLTFQIQSCYGKAHEFSSLSLCVLYMLIDSIHLLLASVCAVISWLNRMTLVVLLVLWLWAAYIFLWHNMALNIPTSIINFMLCWSLLYSWQNTVQIFSRWVI